MFLPKNVQTNELSILPDPWDSMVREPVRSSSNGETNAMRDGEAISLDLGVFGCVVERIHTLFPLHALM